MNNSYIKIGVTVREGRAIVKTATLDKDQVERILVDAFQYDVTKALLAFPTLKQGNTFKFKHGQYGVTLSPLVSHIDNY